MAEGLRGTLPHSAILFSKKRLVQTGLGTAVSALLGLILVMFFLSEDDPTRRPSPQPGGVEVAPPTPAPGESFVALREPFQPTDPAGWRERWELFHAIEPRRGTAAVSSQGLVLAIETRDAHSSTVYTLGVRSRSKFRWAGGLRVRAVLDWRPPQNACYRSAGLRVSGGERADEPAPAVWLEVLGVPPGRTARLYGAARARAGEVPWFTDGWEKGGAGRPIQRVTLEIELRPDVVVLREDGRELVRRPPPPLGDEVWIGLYTTSHANYPERPVTFERVEVETLGAAVGG